MTFEYRNDGPPWRRPSAPSEVVPHGGTFMATEKEHRGIQARAHRRPMMIYLGAAGTDPGTTPCVEWTLRMVPKLYLRLHPHGRHADLARHLTEAAGPADGANGAHD